MKQIITLLLFFFSFIFWSCQSNLFRGIYNCDGSPKMTDTTILHGSKNDIYVDLTCTINQLNFISNDTVIVRVENKQVNTSYVVDKKYVHIKGNKVDLLFKRVDSKTLIAEGPLPGTYHKK